MAVGPEGSLAFSVVCVSKCGRATKSGWCWRYGAGNCYVCAKDKKTCVSTKLSKAETQNAHSSWGKLSLEDRFRVAQLVQNTLAPSSTYQVLSVLPADMVALIGKHGDNLAKKRQATAAAAEATGDVSPSGGTRPTRSSSRVKCSRVGGVEEEDQEEDRGEGSSFGGKSSTLWTVRPILPFSGGMW